MTDLIVVKLVVFEARALAKLASRLTFRNVTKRADICTSYDFRPEMDVMWSGLQRVRMQLSTQLAELGVDRIS